MVAILTLVAAFFNKYPNPAQAHAVFAGTHPAERVHPEAVAARKETNIDLTAARPRQLPRQNLLMLSPESRKVVFRRQGLAEV